MKNPHRPFRLCLRVAVAVALLGIMAAETHSVRRRIHRIAFTAPEKHLIMEFLDDDLLHFELAAGRGPSADEPIYTTPMIFKTNYPGPRQFARSGAEGHILETAEMKVIVDRRRLCLTVIDKTKNLELTTLCPHDLHRRWKGLTLAPNGMRHVYGLGEQFVAPGSPDGDWVGRVRVSGNTEGNALVPFEGGAVENAQFPILYALGRDYENYALFLDDVYKQRWDFTGRPWRVNTWNDQIRGYLMTGPNLLDLRRDYMELVGRPPVPPKKMFGLWISEYGFDDWAELEEKLRSLRANRFPVDGFILDLQWFGGITPNSDHTRMGTLAWDTTHFPHPAATIARLRDTQGIGLILIEESYIGRALPEHELMERKGYLVKDCQGCGATYIAKNPWWGKGGMIDWTNDAAGDYWHDWKRQPLIEMGILGHWTDLGEPEAYNRWAWYYGFPELGKHAHVDVHNLYNFKWSESIFRGRRRHGVTGRPFILSRSGAPGSQRFGVSMWSGDIGSNVKSLAAHLNVHLHMSFSGIDYFGADIGGFHREALDGDLHQLYTRWFAIGAALDVPVRPHTENLCNCKETAPDRIGDRASNLANLRLRYALSPYLYSLAHRAYLYGEPVMPPLVFYYQTDTNVRKMGRERLIGRDLLVVTVTRYGRSKCDVYLPAGTWIRYHTNEWFHSDGQWFRGIPVLVNGRFTLPLFARAGAIIPEMYVDEQTMNIMGRRRDGRRHDELRVRVYAHRSPSQFTLYEDDGETIAYQRGAVRTTVISQRQMDDRVVVTVRGASGTYAGAPARRDTIVKLIVEKRDVEQVSVNGEPLPSYETRQAFAAAHRGWFKAGPHVIIAKSGPVAVKRTKRFIFTLSPLTAR